MTDYKLAKAQLEALIEEERHPMPAMANLSAILMDAMDEINWVGFYLMEGDSLLLGPFQGNVACIRIQVGKGVCGAAVMEDRIQVVEDVHQFPGHIACDCTTNSEIVLPIHSGEKVIGVLDIDSRSFGRFKEEDKEGLQQIVEVLEQGCDWE